MVYRLKYQLLYIKLLELSVVPPDVDRQIVSMLDSCHG